jgi:hypothetical protein
MTPKDQHKIFWDLYPKRNGKKLGKYPCQLWFEAKKPQDFSEMIAWLRTWLSNDEIMTKKKDFHAHLPDPIRFLKNRMWHDDIDELKGATKAKPQCQCGHEATSQVGSKRYCPLCHPYARPKFVKPKINDKASPAKGITSAKDMKGNDTTTPSCPQDSGAGSLSAPLKTILGTDITEAQAKLMDDFRS